MKTIDLISKISKDDIVLMHLYDQLPEVAQKNFNRYVNFGTS